MKQRMWLESINDYDVNINYHKGRINVVTDVLSKKSSQGLVSLVIPNEL